MNPGVETTGFASHNINFRVGVSEGTPLPLGPSYPCVRGQQCGGTVFPLAVGGNDSVGGKLKKGAAKGMSRLLCTRRAVALAKRWGYSCRTSLINPE